MNDVALVTANFGGIDEVYPLPPSAMDSFYFTDAETTKTAKSSHLATWNNVLVPDYPRHGFGPRLRSKYFKQQIHRLLEVTPYRWIAWADSCLAFNETEFLTKAIAALRARPAKDRLMLIPHWKRPTVEEEYRFLSHQLDMGNKYVAARYNKPDLRAKMQYFLKSGLNVDARLWCSTVWIAENNHYLGQCFDAWWDHTVKLGMMDQLSLGVLLPAHSISPLPLSINLLNNPHFKWIRHPKLM